MKFTVLFVCLIALTTVQSSDIIINTVEKVIDATLFEPMQSAFEEQSASPETLEKAQNCITGARDSVNNIIGMGKDIASGNYIGAVKNIISLAKNIIQMLDDCQTLFCFGPTFDKCESQHSQGCEKTGLVVYPKCSEGFSNWGCCLCTKDCPAGYRDDGLYCGKPRAYGRGAGYVIWARDRCESDNSQGCEKYGALWYPKCAAGFHNVGCCICSPNCPSGWTDIGVSCKKPETYGRGVGYPVHFGFECLKEYDDANQQVSCEDQKQEIDILDELVKAKFEEAQTNPQVYQQGLSEQLKVLAEMLENYAETCGYEVEERRLRQ